MTLLLSNEQETRQLAIAIAQQATPGEAITLTGGLGMGKTAFARYFIRSLTGEETDVPSPTFTLVQIYDTPYFPLWHFDLYRLTKQEEALELAIEDAFYEAVSLIEWPDIIIPLLPEDRLEITLLPADQPGARHVLLKGHGTWEQKLQILRKENILCGKN